MASSLRYAILRSGLRSSSRSLSCLESSIGRPSQKISVSRQSSQFGSSLARNNACRLFSSAAAPEDSPDSTMRSPGSVKAGAEAMAHSFQAETRQLLDIVTHSLYTEKEVFVRELISNAADALEKARHMQVSGEAISDSTLPFEINIVTDMKNHRLIIEDSGIGMTKEEMISNLGTIARSGSKAFLQQLKEKGGQLGAAESGIIGKFGVGFYSAFMVADKVEVFSQSAKDGEQAYCWTSDGSGSYSVVEAEGVTRGSKIVIHLKKEAEEYSMNDRVKGIIQKYSNFVSFPIALDGERVNTVEAIWAKDKKDITEEDYGQFYKFIANSFDEPTYTLHFKTDAPLELKTLFFFPSHHFEKFGMGRMEPGVSIYSRKVLIERNAADILPDWLRFIRGVVDSEDLPLSISREKMQDARLLKRIRDVLTRKALRFLEEQAKKDPKAYDEWFKEFGPFLKEGVCTDFYNKDDIGKLLRFETSATKDGENTSLDSYVSRMPPTQENIYYITAPTRALAEASPYLETFKKRGIEVVYLYSSIDDFVMSNLAEFNKRKLQSVEKSDVGLHDDDESEKTSDTALSQEESQQLSGWLTLALDDRVKEVKISKRLEDSPAIVVDHESAAVRRMMQMVNAQSGSEQSLPKQILEINPKHSIIKGLNGLRSRNEDLAKVVADQIFDNALVAAGLLDDSRSMIPRVNKLLEELVTDKDTPSA